MAGCGDDNSTNNNNPVIPTSSESLRVSIDSASTYSGTSFSQFATVYGSTAQYEHYRIAFNVITNVDNCCPVDSSYLKVQSLIYMHPESMIIHVNKTRNQITTANYNFTFTLKDTYGGYEAGHAFIFGFSSGYPAGKYIQVKNLRVYTLHY